MECRPAADVNHTGESATLGGRSPGRTSTRSGGRPPSALCCKTFGHAARLVVYCCYLIEPGGGRSGWKRCLWRHRLSYGGRRTNIGRAAVRRSTIARVRSPHYGLIHTAIGPQGRQSRYYPRLNMQLQELRDALLILGVVSRKCLG